MTRRLRNLRTTSPSLRGSSHGEQSSTQEPTATCCPHPFLTRNPYTHAGSTSPVWPQPAPGLHFPQRVLTAGFLVASGAFWGSKSKVNLILNRSLSWFPEALINLNSALGYPLSSWWWCRDNVGRFHILSPTGVTPRAWHLKSQPTKDRKGHTGFSIFSFLSFVLLTSITCVEAWVAAGILTWNRAFQYSL